MEREISNQQYIQAAEVIKTAILRGQYEAAKGVNRVQLATYYGIGKYVSNNTRNGVWGTGALKAISERLRKDLPGLRGFRETQLKEIRLFYEAWAMIDVSKSVLPTGQLNINSSVATDELQMSGDEDDSVEEISFIVNADFPIEEFLKTPFTHHTVIIRNVADLDARLYYIHRCAEEHMSVDRLKRVIAADEFHHDGKAPNNFLDKIENKDLARKAVAMFKDEYLLDFINVEEIGERDIEDIDERVVEKQIIHNIKKFIMAFGKDFAFVGNQYHLEAYGEECFPDLLFFNRELNALVVIELKTGKFKSGYLGQLMEYLTILDDKVRKPHENPSIGIVLCKEANKRHVEYIIKEYDKPMGVATYTTSQEMPEPLRHALPDMEELKKLL